MYKLMYKITVLFPHEGRAFRLVALAKYPCLV